MHDAVSHWDGRRASVKDAETGERAGWVEKNDGERVTIWLVDPPPDPARP